VTVSEVLLTVQELARSCAMIGVLMIERSATVPRLSELTRDPAPTLSECPPLAPARATVPRLPLMARSPSRRVLAAGEVAKEPVTAIVPTCVVPPVTVMAESRGGGGTGQGNGTGCAIGIDERGLARAGPRIRRTTLWPESSVYVSVVRPPKDLVELALTASRWWWPPSRHSRGYRPPPLHSSRCRPA